MKALWLAFSVEFFILVVIAFLARTMELLFHFLGLFPAVYLLAIVTLLFLVGGGLQVRGPETVS